MRKKWKETHWTDFIVKSVLSFIGSEFDQGEIVTTVAELVKYGFRNENGLKRIAGNPPNRNRFIESLKGILPAICEMLYETAIEVRKPAEPPKTNDETNVAVATEGHTPRHLRQAVCQKTNDERNVRY